MRLIGASLLAILSSSIIANAQGPTPDQLAAAAAQLRGNTIVVTPTVTPPPPAPPISSQAWIERTNQGTVGIVTGGVDGTYIRIGADLMNVLDNGDTLRILPIIGRGSLQNTADLLFLRGVDIVILQSDILAYTRLKHLYPGIEQNIQYITKLYNEEVHILARSDITKLADLQGKPVNIDLTGSGTAMSSLVLFDALHIEADWRTEDQHAALQKLRDGTIAAMVYVVGQPAKLFTELPIDTHLHFLSVPLVKGLDTVYEQSVITAADYPTLVPAKSPVTTVSVGSIMAVYGWQPNSERYHKVARFVDAFFDNFGNFLKPSRHPKWMEVDMMAEVPGWKRFPEANAWLKRRVQTMPNDFNTFLASVPDMSRVAKDHLLIEYRKWWQSHTVPVIDVTGKKPMGGDKGG